MHMTFVRGVSLINLNFTVTHEPDRDEEVLSIDAILGLLRSQSKR